MPKLDPQKIPDDLVDRAARAMHGFNAICQRQDRRWEDCVDPERNHWIGLAKSALIAVSIHADQWPELEHL